MKKVIVIPGIIWAACIGAAAFTGSLWWLLLPFAPVILVAVLILTAIICACLMDLAEWAFGRHKR